MLKRFLDGMIFGAGFALALIVLWSVWIMWALPAMLESMGSRETSEVTQSSPPEIRYEERYLGSPAAYSGKFFDKRKMLAEGPGIIVGRAEVSGKPATGLRLRLALNGEVKSQWAVVDDGGRYSIPVPYGEYRVDGYELDRKSADRVLTGKIDLDRFFPARAVFPVSEISKGLGLNFEFVEPLHLNLAKREFSLSEDVIITWNACPGANQYRIQVRGGSDPNAYGDQSDLFDWGSRPVVSGTSVDLKKLGVEFNAGYYYNVEIEAMDEEGKVVSKTTWNRSGYDFRIE